MEDRLKKRNGAAAVVISEDKLLVIKKRNNLKRCLAKADELTGLQLGYPEDQELVRS